MRLTRNEIECEHCLPPSECIHCNPAYRNAYTAHCSACHPEPGTTAQTWHAADGTCLKCNPNYGNT